MLLIVLLLFDDDTVFGVSSGVEPASFRGGMRSFGRSRPYAQKRERKMKGNIKCHNARHKKRAVLRLMKLSITFASANDVIL